MELFQIRYITEVARQKSFTKAAESLFISQAALSQQIRKIEETLEAPLFIRNTRSVALTEAGETFIRFAQPVLDSAKALESAMLQYKGRQVIRCVSTPRMAALRLAHAEMVFSEQHPNLILQSWSVEENEIYKLAASQEWDIAVLPQKLMGPFRDNTRFYKEHLFSFERCILVSREHPLAGKRSVRLEELEEETFFVETEELTRNTQKETLLPPGVKVDRMSSTNYDVMSVRVASGKSIAVGIKPLADYYGLCAVPIRPRKLDKTFLVCPLYRKAALPVSELGGLFRSLHR